LSNGKGLALAADQGGPSSHFSRLIFCYKNMPFTSLELMLRLWSCG
jgi:hypothetical protein